MPEISNISIVGAGHAAGQLIASLRMGGYSGPINVYGDEPHCPYQRPPLSKAVLKGELDPARTLLKPEAWYADQNVALHLDARVAGLDTGARTLTLHNGDKVDFDRLVLATGARPLALPVPGAGHDGVFLMRTLDDALGLKSMAHAGRRAVIVGAGYIGLEAAAALRSLALEVVVLERQARVLERVTSPLISEFFEKLHRDNGVEVRTNCSIHSVLGQNRVSGVSLADGEQLDCDIVLAGIGIAPNVELAEAAGIACQDGIEVDRDACTSVEGIYAIGDCARRELVHYDRRGRLESVHNALEQAKLAAAHMLGKPRPAEDCPWFWSDQFDVKLQIAGLSQGYDELVVRGDPKLRKFAAFYLRDGVLIAVDAINSPREFMPSKALITARTRCDRAALEDPDVALKSLA